MDKLSGWATSRAVKKSLISRKLDFSHLFCWLVVRICLLAEGEGVRGEARITQLQVLALRIVQHCTVLHAAKIRSRSSQSLSELFCVSCPPFSSIQRAAQRVYVYAGSVCTTPAVGSAYQERHFCVVRRHEVLCLCHVAALRSHAHNNLCLPPAYLECH